MKRTLVTAPTGFPVSTAAVKSQLVIDFPDDDTLVSSLIAAATDMAENVTGRQLMPQVWDHWFDGFPHCVELPVTPLISIDSVKYYDGVNVQQTLLSTLYQTDIIGRPAIIRPVTSWPATYDCPNSVVVRITAGYSSTDVIPAGIKQAILMIVGNLYENRESNIAGTIITEVPMGARMMLEQWAVR